MKSKIFGAKKSCATSVALKSYSTKEPIAKIMKITGLTEAEIKEL